MPGLIDILSGSAEPVDETLNFWIEMPQGYFPLPLTDTEDVLANAEANLRELAPPEQQDLLEAVIGTFTVLLDQLQQRNGVYCGLGWHQAEDGSIVSSSLVLSVQEMGEKRNPRLVLGDLVDLKAEAGEHGQADLVDLASGPVLFFESIITLQRPRLPNVDGPAGDAAGDAEVYQLSAMVPSDDGTRLVAVEFSTPYVSHGPQFRTMMVLMANSVSFTPPVGSDDAGSTAQSINQILGGLGS
jgi:hypothetical protein